MNVPPSEILGQVGAKIIRCWTGNRYSIYCIANEFKG